MSKQPAKEQGTSRSRSSSSSMKLEQDRAAADMVSSGSKIQTGQGPLSAGTIMQMQRSIGNRGLGQWLQGGRGKASAGSPAPLQRKENRTGMPDGLKSGVEQLSGMSLDDVQVHYNSAKPAEVEALAYAKGTDIYVGPGQEKHLPHEAWHVVQQQEGRVAPTMEHNGEAINDDRALESEADAMGTQALREGDGAIQRIAVSESAPSADAHPSFAEGDSADRGISGVVQRTVVNDRGDEATLDEISNYFLENDLEQGIEDRELKREFNKEASRDREISIERFLNNINAFAESESEDSEDEDWDPSEHAADPMDPDDILSSGVRRSLSFNAGAKAYMKLDTPKDKTGHYMCHICQDRIEKGESVDMDHLPPWKERLHAYIEDKELTVDDHDELSGPAMKMLYNMRGSVFAHSSCNRGHSGEGNYKKKWKTALAWYQAGGGSPFK